MGSCISGWGEGNVIHDFWYLGKGDECETKLLLSFFFTFDLFTIGINIHLNNSDSMFFLPFLAENYESYFIYVK